MLDLCLLGTGGMMPLPYRRLTALMMRYNGSSLLIDCGEGTQVAIRERGWSFHDIDVVCITHFHGDHISGLPGLLLSMGNADRTEPLTIVGPKGLERTVNALRVIAPELPFEIKFIEIADAVTELNLFGYRINAFKVNHRVTCYGYSVMIDRAGKFDPEKAAANNVPMKAWSRLQKGQTVEIDGITYTQDFGQKTKEYKGRELFYEGFENIEVKIRKESFFVDNASYSSLRDCITKDGLEGYASVEMPTYFDHYFRLLYRILKFVDTTDLIEKDKEKYEYTSMIRAILSRYELVWLYYNGL
jgi:ribonuclease Z